MKSKVTSIGNRIKSLENQISGVIENCCSSDGEPVYIKRGEALMKQVQAAEAELAKAARASSPQN